MKSISSLMKRLQRNKSSRLKRGSIGRSILIHQSVSFQSMRALNTASVCFKRELKSLSTITRISGIKLSIYGYLKTQRRSTTSPYSPKTRSLRFSEVHVHSTSITSKPSSTDLSLQLLKFESLRSSSQWISLMQRCARLTTLKTDTMICSNHTNPNPRAMSMNSQKARPITCLLKQT